MSDTFRSETAMEVFKEALIGTGVTILPDMTGPVDKIKENGEDEVMTAVTQKIRKVDLTTEYLREAFARDGVTAVAPYAVLDMSLMYPVPPTSVLDPVTFETKELTAEESRAAVEAADVYLIRAYFRKEKTQ